MPKKKPRVVVIAGPNGAGKSTHADALLEAFDIAIFVNADYIARGLSGRNTDAVAFEAGRIMLKRLRQLASEKADFAFESTLSSKTFAPFLRKLRADGYEVIILYFSLANATIAVRRVRQRVKLGGHDVPAEVVRRRFARSAENLFSLYFLSCDAWVVFDNSLGQTAFIVAMHDGFVLTVQDVPAWNRLKHLAKHR
jgi:predicted ABC-type ATPase